MNKKIVISSISILITLVILILWFFLINKKKNQISNIEETNISKMSPEQIDQQIQKFAQKFTGESIMINKETNAIDLSFSFKDILDKYYRCSPDNIELCKRSVSHVIEEISKYTLQWYKLDYNSYWVLIDLFAMYKMNNKEVLDIIRSSNNDQLKSMYKEYKFKSIEDNLSYVFDSGAQNDIITKFMACKNITILNCKSLYYKDNEKKCEEIKKSCM